MIGYSPRAAILLLVLAESGSGCEWAGPGLGVVRPAGSLQVIYTANLLACITVIVQKS